jgi:two-component system, cell cycle sensor histidine kinase and response regulator CckA
MIGRFANALRTDPENWRAGLLTLILRATVGLGLLVYLPSVYLSIHVGLVGVAVIDTAALLTVIGLLYFDRLPFRWRAAGCCLTFYVLSVGLLIGVGSISQIYLFGFSILTALLLGVRTGLFSALLSSATMLGVGYLGCASPEMAIPNWNASFPAWCVITLNFTLVNTTLTLAIGAVLSALNIALSREIAARASLDRERTLLRTLLDAMPDVVVTKDANGRFVNCNRATLAVVGLAREEQLAGKTVFDLYSREIAEPYHAGDLQVLAGRTLLNQEEPGVDSKGLPLWYLTIKVPLRTATGEIVGLLAISRDVTERKKLEMQLQQAQKMEAFGQLAGGVAHDFNNLLTIITGYTELLLGGGVAADKQRPFIREIRSAAERAAALTRQLLAFSRKQILQPVHLNLNTLVANTEKMLRRLIGEDIDLATRLDPALGQVKADPGQIEQVIVNLVVNARDAMPTGGHLTIETRNVELDQDYVRSHPEARPGGQVLLAVADSGCGMDAATSVRIFEPFFTTKEVGKGTGLGLATVHGIVKQSNGSIEVYSELGHGSTFKVYLPRLAGPVAAGNSDPAVSVMPRGTETILLTEDESGVRAFVRFALESLGYTVLEARHGEESLRICQQHTGLIHLLLTDVVMPKVSGRQLADLATGLHPNMKVLYMSGYTDDAVVRHGVLQAGMAFLQKPVTLMLLARKVREVLDADKT